VSSYLHLASGDGIALSSGAVHIRVAMTIIDRHQRIPVEDVGATTVAHGVGDFTVRVCSAPVRGRGTAVSCIIYASERAITTLLSSAHHDVATFSALHERFALRALLPGLGYQRKRKGIDLISTVGGGALMGRRAEILFQFA
jgi:hypothetical protein